MFYQGGVDVKKVGKKFARRMDLKEDTNDIVFIECVGAFPTFPRWWPCGGWMWGGG